ncbi:MAG: Mur ligase family protein, partial [bacterium]|nr:Mur ligase family protein [bacterium]
MKLSELLQGMAYQRVSGSLQREISGLALDSRQVRDGYGFVAVKGAVTDGHRYAADAVQRGAVAVLCTEGVVALPEHVTVVRMGCTPGTLSELAQRLYGQPRCVLIGITGTNGKTTSAYFTRYFLERHGWPCGLIGTVVYEFGGRSIPAARTTPDIFELHRLLHQMAGAGARAVVMEVSSHALAQERIGRLEYDVAVFTNLTQDHLDFHHTMEEYYRAKRKLFDHLAQGGRVGVARAIVMVDDTWGERLAGCLLYTSP